MKSKSKSSTQDKVSELERKIIELQRELDAARKNSTSIWCKLFDNLIDAEYSEEASKEISEIVSETVLNWVKAQRAKINRTVSSIGVMPPYTDCLNDLVISSCDPETDHSELLPPEEPDRELPEVSQIVRVPSPPVPNRQGEDPSLHMGPTKLLKVNIPKPFADAPPSHFPPSAP